MAAAGIGWVDGITYETSAEGNIEAMTLCLAWGVKVNDVNDDGRGALHGAAHEGRNAAVQLLVDRGATLDLKDKGNRDTRAGSLLAGVGWTPLDFAKGVVRIGVQSAIRQPHTVRLLRKLLAEHGLPVPEPRTPLSECLPQRAK